MCIHIDNIIEDVSEDYSIDMNLSVYVQDYDDAYPGEVEVEKEETDILFE